MLMADWTGQFAQERVADLHRQAEHQRLARLAKAQRRGGTGGVGRWRRWRAGSATRFGRGRRPVLDYAIKRSTVGDAMSSS